MTPAAINPYVKIGTFKYRGEEKGAIIPDSVRDRHLYVVGKTRTGKSTLITNCALQDIEAGKGVAVIDPHGDLVEDLLRYIPKSRVADTIYFDAGAKDTPLGLNPMVAHSEDEIGLLADELMVIFKRLSDSWGPQMENILGYVFHTLLRTPGTNFLDIGTILQDEDFRTRIIRKLPKGPLIHFWTQQFPSLEGSGTQPILNRMSRFMLSPALAAVLSQRTNTIHFGDVLQRRKILLVNLSQGRIGELSAHLLGSLLVSQIQMATMRRAVLPKSERVPFYLYVDEFQNFISPAFEKILAEAGKYQLCLTLAHQYISQLSDGIRAAILGNVGTILIFSLGFQDAKFLSPELGRFQVEDVVNIDRSSYQAFCRPVTKASDTFLFKTLPSPPLPTPHYADEIIAASRARSRAESAAENTPPEPEAVSAQPSAKTPVSDTPALLQPRPEEPKPFASRKDKVLYYIGQAEWLSQQQLIALCFSDYSTEASQKKNASTTLTSLVEDKQLRRDQFGPGKIYFAGRTPKPSNHNLTLRDLYVKIVRSGFEIADCLFFYPELPTLSPDLFVAFAATGDGLIKTFWEYDTGTENIGEIRRKAERYQTSEYDRLTFIVTSQDRLAKLMQWVSLPNTCFAVLDTFSTLNDSAFWTSEAAAARPFFEI